MNLQYLKYRQKLLRKKMHREAKLEAERENEPGGITVKDYSGYGNHGAFAAISGDTTAHPTWEKL